MAITRAQQFKQMLREGGRIGFRGGADAATQSFAESLGGGGQKGKDYAASVGARPDSTFRGGDDRGGGPTFDRIVEDAGQKVAVRTPASTISKKQIAKAKEQRNFAKSLAADRQRKLLRQAEINRKKGIFSFQDFVRRTKDANLASLGQVDQLFGNLRLGKIQVPTFAGAIPDAFYVNPATDFFDVDSLREIASTLTTTQGGLTKQQTKDLRDLRQDIDFQDRLNKGEDIPFEEKQAYINRNKNLLPKDDGPSDPCLGPNPPPYCFIGKKADETVAAQNAIARNLGGLSPRIGGSIFDFTGLADGGRVSAMDGGIMDMVREEMFLGGVVKGIKKGLKGATRAIKKVAKSPFGKAALLAAPFLMSGGLPSFLKGDALKSFFLKNADKGFSLANLSDKGVFAGIAGLSALAGLTAPKQDEDEFDLDAYYASSKLDPNPDIFPRILGSQFAAADGGRAGYKEGSIESGAMMSEKEMKKLAKSPLYKGFKKMYGIDPSMARDNPAYDEKFSAFEELFKKGFQDGGDVEPVAKKTMPLLDMGGQEMDLRAEGGFVPIGRMEKADDVPARLSKNEFVFTAEAVRNAGDGDVDKGAEVMYNMMKNLEDGGNVSDESQGLEGAQRMFQTSKRLEEVL